MKDLDEKHFSKKTLDNWYRHFCKLETYCRNNVNGQIPDLEVLDEELAQWIAIQRNIKNRLPSELKNKLADLNFDFEEQEGSWEHRYRQLVRFVNKNGHTYLSPDDLKYEALRDWLLRQILDKRLLSESQFQKLDLLGVDWGMATSRGHRWELMYVKLKEFHKSYGHCRVPQKWDEDKKLANWVCVQRRSYAANKMRKDREQRLNALDFVWNVKKVLDQSWEQFYQQLATFYKKHSHCRVPGRYQKLASWVERQRTLRKNKLLQAERKRLLDEINFIWDFKNINENCWNKKYRQLQEYQQQHGHSFVPVGYKKNKSLGRWVALQRRLEAKGKLEAVKKKQLNSLSFVWSKDTGRKMNEIYEAQWNANFEKLKAYQKIYNTCQVSLKIDPVLQRWTRRQRELYYQGSSAEDRIAKLNEIKFPWNINEGYWMKMFRALIRFHHEFGHTRVPFQWVPNPKLAAWVYRIKKNKHELDSRQINLLKSIGFDWTLNRRKVVAWREMYGRLLAFKQQYGHTRVPVKWPKDPKLGKWVSRMRYKKEYLSQERISLLEAIEFYWGYRYAPELTYSSGAKAIYLIPPSSFKLFQLDLHTSKNWIEKTKLPPKKLS